MANQIYNASFLQREAEDQFESHLNMEQFATVDKSLTTANGMEVTVRRYKASNGTEKVKMGEGNTKSIETSFTDVKYTIECAQNRFEYFDEQMMTDPYAMAVGVRHTATDMYNTENADIYGELLKTPNKLTASVPNFDAFTDGVAMLNVEGTDNDPKQIKAFAFGCPKDVAKIRKALKDDLKYVEAFVRTGYIGTVAGVNLYTKKNATEGKIALGTKKAVKLFNKKGIEQELITKGVRSAEDANKRKNTLFLRKYYVAALEFEDQAVVIDLTSGA